MNQSPEKRQIILRSAIELFARYGFAKTSLEDIARGALVAKATIYYYYPSKEELFIAAIREKAEEFFAALTAEIDAEPSFSGKLSCFLRLPMKYIYQHMPILAEAMHQIPPNFFIGLDENKADYRNRMNALLTRIMEDGKAQGIIDPDIDSERFSELVNDWFLMSDSWIEPDYMQMIVERIERDHELLIRLILYGIVRQPPEKPSPPENPIPKRKKK